MAKVLKQTAEEKVYISKEDTPLLEDINICIPTTELHSLDEALDRVGVGVFHVILVLVAGWALASDSVEVQCISFVTPQIDRNDSDPSHKVNVSLSSRVWSHNVNSQNSYSRKPGHKMTVSQSISPLYMSISKC